MHIPIKTRKTFIFSACLFIFPFTYGCERELAGEVSVKTTSRTDYCISDKAIAGYQNELLELAFEVATLIPVKPHLKDRSRAQQAVIETCLKMGQPVRAVRYADKIDNWRRGLSYANVAYYLAMNGHAGEKVQPGLDLAEKIANLDHGQQWRTDRINARIAQTYSVLGQTEKSFQYTRDLMDSKSGKMAQAKAKTGKKDSFQEQVKSLDSLVAQGGLETTVNGLQGYTELFSRFYNDLEKRNLVEEKITSSRNKLPVSIQIEFMSKLIECSIDHSDQSKSRGLVEETQTLIKDYRWTTEEYIPLSAKLICLRFQAGDVTEARLQAETLRSLFETDGKKIIDIYRARILLPLAETYQMMGETETSLAVYRQAIEEAVENPNSKPRAEDLSATCCSMTCHQVEPDAELWAYIHGIHSRLGNPW